MFRQILFQHLITFLFLWMLWQLYPTFRLAIAAWRQPPDKPARKKREPKPRSPDDCTLCRCESQAVEQPEKREVISRSAPCRRCHSGQGFLAWIAQGDLTKRIQGADGDATEEELTALGMTNDMVQAITCAVCHDPHNVGKSSGEPNTATVRIDGSTDMLPAGFKALGVGRGALCMTCHNSRNGERNDVATETADDRAPHTASQADMLMGENAYFVSVGQRSKHSLVENTCTGCTWCWRRRRQSTAARVPEPTTSSKPAWTSAASATEPMMAASFPMWSRPRWRS